MTSINNTLEAIFKSEECLNFISPKVPKEVGGLGNLGQCLKLYGFLEGIPESILNKIRKIS